MPSQLSIHRAVAAWVSPVTSQKVLIIVSSSPSLATQDPNSLFNTAIAFELAIGFGGLILGLLIGPESREMVPEWFDAQRIGEGLLWGTIAALPLTLAVVAFSAIPLDSIRKLNRLAEQQLQPMFGQFTWAQLIVLAIAAGICEELFFRGWLQCFLSGPLPPNSPWEEPKVLLGVILASIAFGMCHAVTRMYFVLATLAGVFFGALLVETSNLLIPITAHAVYDILMLTRLRRSKPALSESDARSSTR